MGGAALLAACLAAAPIKLASPGFRVLALAEQTGQFYSDHFAARFAGDERFLVVTKSDITAALAVERQQQLLGCDTSESSCMAELAGALGAEGIITGQVAKVGDAFQLNVRILTAGSRAMYTHSSALLESEKELIAELNRCAEEARGLVALDLRGAEARAPRRPSRWLALIPAIAGVGVAGVGAALLVDAGDRYAALNDPTKWRSYGMTEANDLAANGRRSETSGAVLLAVGAALLIAGALWFLLVSQ